MATLRKIALLLAMVYFLFLVLVITNLVSPDFLDREFTHFNPQNFFKVLMLIGAALLALVLAVEQSHASLLRRRLTATEATVHQLKAQLFDHQRTTTGSVVERAGVPPVAPAAVPPPPRPLGPDDLL